MLGTFDWASHQLRKKTGIDGKNAKMLFSFQFAVINVHDIAYLLKSVEGDPDWQQEIQKRNVNWDAKCRTQIMEARGRKVKILKAE